MKYAWILALVVLPSFLLPGLVFNNDHLGISFTLPGSSWGEASKHTGLSPISGWIVEYTNPALLAFVAFRGSNDGSSNFSNIDTAISMLKGAATQMWVVRNLQFKVGNNPTIAQELRYTVNGIGYSGLIVAFSRGRKRFLFLFGAGDIRFSSAIGDFRKILQSIRLK